MRNQNGGQRVTLRKKVFRPRWLLLALAVAALLVPVLLITTGGTATASHTGLPYGTAHPIVDAHWIYDHDWINATNFIYKRAGSDGCLAAATSCNTSGGGTPGDSNNLPPNYNG